MQKSQRNNVARYFGVIFGIAVLAVCVCFVTSSLMIGYAWKHANDPITDQSKYPDLFAELRRLNLAKHFPEHCPENTIGLYFAPRFLQAPIVLQLRVSVSPDMITEIERTIPKKFVTTDSTGYSIDSNSPPGPYVFWDLKNKKNRIHEIPDTFEYWNHRGVAASTYDDKASWNHGEIDGIAIDRKNLEVLYYSEAW